MEDLHVVCFSGGKDSTAMLLHMMELGMKIDVVLYCDTWMEFPAMYRHVEKVKKIVEDAGIKFVTLKNEKSFKYLMLEHQPERRKSTQEKLGGNPKGYSWAGSRSRWCTSKLKTELLRGYKQELSSKYHVIEYVGIASDDSRVSCWCCPLKSLAELRNLRKYFPDLWQELKEMDKQTWGKFRFDFSVEELEIRFQLEEERVNAGLPINSHNVDFREALKNALHKK